MIEEPADLMDISRYGPDRCREESPAWGYEADGEQCARPAGHGGAHYTIGQDFASGGQVAVQWEVRK